MMKNNLNMDDNFDNKKYSNNNIIKPKKVKFNSDLIDYSNIENNHKYKFKHKLTKQSPKGINTNHSVTENKNKFKEFKGNILHNVGPKIKFNNESDKDKKFIRLKKGVHLRIKSRTARNNKNNDKNKTTPKEKKQLKILKKKQKESKSFLENLTNREPVRKTAILSHSYSLDNYLNFNSNFDMKLKNSLENSQIFDKSFVFNIKNKKRKNDLIKAIEKYKRFRTLIPNKSEELFHKGENKYNNENVDKRKEQINRIKIQNIINFRKVYESIQNRKSLEQEKERRKTIYDIENDHKKIFVRQLLREEKYVIDNEGKEKILEINHSVLPNKIIMQNNESLKDINDEKNKKIINITKENYNNSGGRNIIDNKKFVKANIENDNFSFLKGRSYQNMNNNVKPIINSIKNKIIFIKKHPTNHKINYSPKLNKKNIKNIFNESQCPDYNNSYCNILNHRYHEIKNVNETDVNNIYQNNIKYNKKILKRNIILKPNHLKNNSFKITCDTSRNNNFSDNNKINIGKNKNIFHSNRSYDSKRNNQNNFIYEITNKEKQNSSKQYILFNLNNQNNSNINKNNNFIIINASPSYN